MSQGSGSIASDLKKSEQDGKSPGVSLGEQSGVVSAEDGRSDPLKVVDEKKDIPPVAEPQLGRERKGESFVGEKAGDETGPRSPQHHAGESGIGNHGAEQTCLKDASSKQVNKVDKLQVGEQGNVIGGDVAKATVPESANEDSKEDTSSWKDKSCVVGMPSVRKDKETDCCNAEMDTKRQVKFENAKVDKCSEPSAAVQNEQGVPSSAGNVPFYLDFKSFTGDGSGTEQEQALFMKELISFHKERNLEFKPPKFYGGGLNCLKLWRAVIKLGGYDQVTLCKLWRQVGESFNPPKTCTTVSWSFRSFYEKALLEYEKQKISSGELQIPRSCYAEKQEINLPSVLGKARRDAATRSVHGWHAQQSQGNGDFSVSKLKERSPTSLFKHDKHLKNIGGFKRKKSSIEHTVKHPRTMVAKSQMDAEVADVGAPADWVKINVIRTKDCFEVYALVPGLLREEVHVQSDAAGQVVISGEPEQPDNPWGVTPFKKIITLPSRIDPYQTSAIVTLHGQLVVRAPFERKAGLF